MRAISSSGKPAPLSDTASFTRSPANSVRTSIAGLAPECLTFSSASCAFWTRLWITWRICSASPSLPRSPGQLGAHLDRRAGAGVPDVLQRILRILDEIVDHLADLRR